MLSAYTVEDKELKLERYETSKSVERSSQELKKERERNNEGTLSYT